MTQKECYETIINVKLTVLRSEFAGRGRKVSKTFISVREAPRPATLAKRYLPNKTHVLATVTTLATPNVVTIALATSLIEVEH